MCLEISGGFVMVLRFCRGCVGRIRGHARGITDRRVMLFVALSAAIFRLTCFGLMIT